MRVKTNDPELIEIFQLLKSDNLAEQKIERLLNKVFSKESLSIEMIDGDDENYNLEIPSR